MTATITITRLIADQRHHVGRAGGDEHALHGETPRPQRASKSECQTRQRAARARAAESASAPAPFGAQRHADADFLRALRHRIGRHAVAGRLPRAAQSRRRRTPGTSSRSGAAASDSSPESRPSSGCWSRHVADRSPNPHEAATSRPRDGRAHHQVHGHRHRGRSVRG